LIFTCSYVICSCVLHSHAHATPEKVQDNPVIETGFVLPSVMWCVS